MLPFVFGVFFAHIFSLQELLMSHFQKHVKYFGMVVRIQNLNREESLSLTSECGNCKSGKSYLDKEH